MASYETIPSNVIPDVPYWVNLVVRDIAGDITALQNSLVIHDEPLTSTSDRTTLKPGWHRVTNNATAAALGLPPKPGILGHINILASGAAIQNYQTMDAAGAPSIMYTSQLNGTTWSPMKNVNHVPLEKLTGTSDLTKCEPGIPYLISNVQMARDLKMPRERPGIFMDYAIGTKGHVSTFMSIEDAPQPNLMYLGGIDLAGNVQEWNRISFDGLTGGAGADGLARRSLLQQGLTARKGGRIGTNNKGAIALRIDDAPAEFITEMLPEIESRGLPFTRVTTSKSVNGVALPANTFSDMQTYLIRAGGEAHAHGEDHKNASGDTAIQKNLIDSAEDIRAAMPRIPIDCFAPPGGSVSYDGYMPSNGVENYADTYAGQALISNFALVSGYFQNSYYRPMDGILRDGQNHYSVDLYDATRAKELVDRARDWKKGVVLMWHANNLGAPDNMTKAQFIEVLDYIVAQRDAGNIVVLTVSGLAVADLATSYRDNILTKSTGNPFTESLVYPQFRQNIPGSTRELVATVTGTAGATVTSVIGESTKTHTIPAGGTLKLRHVATIPLDVTALTVSINANTSGATLNAV